MQVFAIICTTLGGQIVPVQNMKDHFQGYFAFVNVLSMKMGMGTCGRYFGMQASLRPGMCWQSQINKTWGTPQEVNVLVSDVPTILIRQRSRVEVKAPQCAVKTGFWCGDQLVKQLKHMSFAVWAICFWRRRLKVPELLQSAVYYVQLHVITAYSGFKNVVTYILCQSLNENVGFDEH